MSSIFNSIKNLASSHSREDSDNQAEAGEMKFSLTPPSLSPGNSSQNIAVNAPDGTSDFNQWLHAMKMVARLPGGMPPEFRKKLWLALSDKHIQTRGFDWTKEEVKCLSDQWRTDDEELGIQIVKDLHRTGSSLCSGPTGTINQAKLKRVLLGYARWNPEVGYCQGFNMLGALILQVMDKNEGDSIKVMILLVEGVLPHGYFSGSLGGLQADMAVFREILSTKLPRLSRHLQKLQGSSSEGAFEPPLTNVFTMQWFLTLFCTCLPTNCVLRIWDLILIEGSDVLLRTALAIWTLLEDRILNVRTADDFYCKMGTISGDLLNGSIIDSNGLIQKIVDLGPIQELQKLRDKHLYNIAPWREKKGLKMLYSDDEGESDDDSRLAVTTAWGLRVARRGSLGLTQNFRNIPDSRERLALDITLLKQQYAKLRERQRQAHIILTAACARQTVNQTQSSAMQMNQFLLGRNAILPKGRRIGPPPGSVPPARKIITPKPVKSNLKPPKRGETLHWKDTELTQRRKNSLKWKELNAERGSFNQDDVSEKSDKEIIQSTSSASSLSNISDVSQSSPARTHKKSESSSYSEESDEKSSTSTSLCDDENFKGSQCSSLEQSPIKKKISPEIEVPEGNKSEDIQKYIDSIKETFHFSDDEEEIDDVIIEETKSELIEIEKENLIDINFDEKKPVSKRDEKTEVSEIDKKPLPPIQIICSNLDNSEISSSENSSLNISSISQLSPIPDISKYISMSSISPLRTPSSLMDYSDYMSNVPSNDSSERSSTTINLKTDEISYEGVTNELFERMNSAERPTRLDIPVTGIGPNKMYSSDSQQPSCSSSSYTIELQLKNDSPMENSFQEVDRLKFLKEKSFSLDEPSKDKETLQATSCPEIRADVVSKKNSDRVLKIIQENSMILHRILKKNSSDSLIEEGSDEEKNETPKIDSKINSPIIHKSPDFHFKEFKSFVKNSPSIEKLFEETFDEPNSEKSSKIESPEYISKESKAIVEKFPSFEKLSEFSSFEGRKIYSPDYLSSESRDTSVPELKSFETDNDGCRDFKEYSIIRENSCPKMLDLEVVSKFETDLVIENKSKLAKDENNSIFENFKDEPDFSSKYDTSSKLSENDRNSKINKESPEKENLYSKSKKFEYTSKYDSLDYGVSSIKPIEDSLKNSETSSISKLTCIEKKEIDLNSSFSSSKSREKVFEFESDFETKNRIQSVEDSHSFTNPKNIEMFESSYTSSKSREIDSNSTNIEKKETEFESSYPSSKSRERHFEFETKTKIDKVEKSFTNPTNIEKKEVEFESSYPSSKSREKLFEFETKTKIDSVEESSTNIEKKEMEFESSFPSSKSREKFLEFEINTKIDSVEESSTNLTNIAKKEKEFESSYPSSKSREKLFEFDTKTKIEEFYTNPTNIERKETEFESSYPSSKSRESDSKTKIDAEEPTTDYFSYKSKLDDVSEDNSKIRTSKFDFYSKEYSSTKSSSFSLNLNRDYSDSQSEFQPKCESNISDTLSSIENTIQTINNLCQVKDVPIVSVEDTDPTKNLSIKQFLTENNDWNRTRDRSSSRSHREYKRDASPRRRRDEEIEEYQSQMSRRDPSVSTEKSKRIPERPEIRHTTVTCTFYDRFLSQKMEKNSKLDKSPSSPVITKSYLESLRPTSSSTDRIVKSAESSPSRQKYDSPTIKKSAVIASLHYFDLNKKEVRSCDNILEKVTQSSRNFSPLPLKPHSPSELSLKLGLYKTPSPIKTTPKS